MTEYNMFLFFSWNICKNYIYWNTSKFFLSKPSSSYFLYHIFVSVDFSCFWFFLPEIVAITLDSIFIRHIFCNIKISIISIHIFYLCIAGKRSSFNTSTPCSDFFENLHYILFLFTEICFVQFYRNFRIAKKYRIWKYNLFLSFSMAK